MDGTLIASAVGVGISFIGSALVVANRLGRQSQTIDHCVESITKLEASSSGLVTRVASLESTVSSEIKRLDHLETQVNHQQSVHE